MTKWLTLVNSVHISCGKLHKVGYANKTLSAYHPYPCSTLSEENVCCIILQHIMALKSYLQLFLCLQSLHICLNVDFSLHAVCTSSMHL